VQLNESLSGIKGTCLGPSGKRKRIPKLWTGILTINSSKKRRRKNSMTDDKKFLVIQTGHDGYVSCLDYLEEELVRYMPQANFDGTAENIFDDVVEFTRIKRLQDAINTLRALCTWADGYGGTIQ
jgi:hypothetical protein